MYNGVYKCVHSTGSITPNGLKASVCTISASKQHKRVLVRQAEKIGMSSIKLGILFYFFIFYFFIFYFSFICGLSMLTREF